ncbi:DUF445 domain-containing protein [Pollutimonas bauzanensis]|uniref:DUF445 domain-containing protein n=1 Tax=Pollutimonas bauzanensis TaxID=658167 RepID=UPI00333F665D
MKPQPAGSSTLDPRHAALRRMKIVAAALLAAMVSGFIISHLMGGQGAWAWVRAFCEAATVGALADWFAVVALFRHPLGLPIPHTAIIPQNKERIGDNLAVFVRDHFLDPDALLEKLKVFDPAARLGQWINDPEQAGRVSEAARQVAVQVLDLMDEAAVRKVMQEFIIANLQRWDAGRSASDVLGLLTRDGRHQRLLDEALQRLANHLATDPVKQRASDLLLKHAKKEWPKIVGAVGLVSSTDDMADKLADKLAAAIIDELHDMLSQPDHPVRRDYEDWVMDYIDRLGTDPDVAAQIESLKQRIINNLQVQDYVKHLWDEIHAALRKDLLTPESTLAQHLKKALLAMGTKLVSEPSLREALNNHLLSSAQKLTETLRSGVTQHISHTIKNWDERHLVDELELSVGRDLQYIRFNGTLVGGLIGVLLHAIVLLVNG